MKSIWVNSVYFLTFFSDVCDVVNMNIFYQVYEEFTEWSNPSENPELSDSILSSNENYRKALESLLNPEPPDEYKDCQSLQEQLVHKTFLEELMFWTVKFEFPQKIVCLLLNMLPDPDYKV